MACAIPREKPAGNGRPLTVADLARAKQLPVAFLHELGVAGLPGGGVAVPYFDLDGAEVYRRERDRPGGPRFRQPAGVRLRPYGLWLLDTARQAGHVYLTEGESDAWSLWHHGLPALGIPGAAAAKSLEGEYLSGLDTAYLLPDADQAGEKLVADVARRLARLHRGGRLWRVRLPAGLKDVSDWHARGPGQFAAELAEAVRRAEAVELQGAAASVGSVGRRRVSVPRHLPPYRPFPLQALPSVLRDYVEAAAAAIGCDPALVALHVLAVVAGCIGNSRAILLKRGWSEPSVLWVITIALSGSLKSPAFSAAVNPLLETQMDLADAHQEARRCYEDVLAAWRELPKGERGQKPEAPPRPPCYVTSDATIEAVGALLADNPRGLLLARDELDGWFGSFTRYKGKAGGSDRPHWLELHRAGTLRLDRLTRESGPLSVRRACASVAGTIQPGVLARSLDDEAMAAGLGARFLLAMPPHRRRIWTEAEVDEHLARRYGELLRSLLVLPLAGAAKRRPHYLALAPDAKRVWVEWFGRWGEAIEAAEGEQAAALAKLEGYAARLALVHHVAACVAADASDLRDVTDPSVRAGTALAEWFAGEAVRVYATIKESTVERERRRLVEWVASRGGKVTVRDLQRANSRRWPSREEAEAELEGLARNGLGEWAEGPAPPQGGHPPRWFQLHATAPDTSDTRHEADAPAGAQAPDGRTDACPAAPDFPAENDRVSEVSGVGTSHGEDEEGPATEGGPGGVSELSDGDYLDGIDPFPNEEPTP